MGSMIGHNRGPSLDPGHGWRRYCWQRARQDLLGPALPLEVVRMRMRRAEELGLRYPAYASILRGTGRDIFAFLFTTEALGLRLKRRLEMPDAVKARLATIRRAERTAFAPEGEAPEPFRIELQEVAGSRFAACAPPPAGDGWGTARDAISALLRDAQVPGDTVVLIGTEDRHRAWAEAGRLAKFLPAGVYFDPPRPGA